MQQEVTNHEPYQSVSQRSSQYDISEYPGNFGFRYLGQNQVRQNCQHAGVRRAFDCVFDCGGMLERETATCEFQQSACDDAADAPSGNHSGQSSACVAGCGKACAQESCSQSAGDGYLCGQEFGGVVSVSAEVFAADWGCRGQTGC